MAALLWSRTLGHIGLDGEMNSSTINEGEGGETSWGRFEGRGQEMGRDTKEGLGHQNTYASSAL